MAVTLDGVVNNQHLEVPIGDMHKGRNRVGTAGNGQHRLAAR